MTTPIQRKLYLSRFISPEALTLQDKLWACNNKQVTLEWDKFINPHRYDITLEERSQLDKLKAMRVLCQIDRVYLMSQIL